MGQLLAGPMRESMARNSDLMWDRQKELMMKQRQVQLATQFSLGKERFLWFTTFVSIAFPLMIIGAIRKQKPQMAAPMLPLSFVFAYQYDMFYGNKMYRVRTEAERLLKEEPELFYLPRGNEIYTEEQYKNALNIRKQ